LKILILGGIKSGKSSFAEDITLKNSSTKPYYLATTEFIDDEMRKKIFIHKQRRASKFINIEESLNLFETIKNLENSDGLVLVECISMWLNNMLYHQKSDEAIFSEIEKVLSLKNSLVFVVNDVSKSVVSENALVRKFVDLSGIISQMIAKESSEVYYVNAGIGTKLK